MILNILLFNILYLIKSAKIVYINNW